jgi:hypothetical protein
MPVEVVTRDVKLCLRAEAVGIETMELLEKYKKERPPPNPWGARDLMVKSGL